MAGKKGLRNALGHDGTGTGRKPFMLEKEFWDKLDGKLPEAVDYCCDVIKEAEGVGKNLIAKLGKEVSPIAAKIIVDKMIEWKKLGLRAAEILISKAPDRVRGTGEGGAMEYSLDDESKKMLNDFILWRKKQI